MKRLPTEVRRAQIAEAALRIVARDGLAAFTTSAIARETNLAEGTLFRHFRNKEEMVEAAIERLGTLLLPRREVERPGDPLAELRGIVEHRAALLKEKPGYLRILLSDELAHAAAGPAREQLARLRRRAVEQIGRVIEAAVAAGQVRGDVSVHTLAALVRGLLMLQVFGEHGGEQGGAALPPFETLWSELLVVLSPPAPAPRPRGPAAAAPREEDQP